MKPRFAFEDAFTAPFVLLRRRPLELFVWGLMMTALAAAMYALFIPLLATTLGTDSSEQAVDAYLLESVRLQLAVNGLNLLLYGVMLLTWTAAGRAVLAPGTRDRFLFLRIGMDEVRIAVVMIAIFAGWYIGFFVLCLLGFAIGLSLWFASQPLAIGVGVAYGIGLVALSVWALVRVSLIAPASLILKRFAFVEGWRIAGGQVWKLVGLHLLIWLTYMIGLIVIYAVVGGILAAGFFSQGLTWPSQVERVADVMPMLRAMIAPALLAVVPLALGFGWMMAMYVAPGVTAARQLLDGAPMAGDAASADELQSV